MVDCLKLIFGESISGVDVRNKRVVKNEWITTRKNSIRLPPDFSVGQFFSNPHLMLHECYHVIHQWNVGKLSRSAYMAEFLRNGPEAGNRFEDAANAFADQNQADFENCLKKASKCEK